MSFFSSGFREFMRYCIAGLGSAAVDIGSYSVLTFVLHGHPLGANLLSRTLGGMTCFVLNRYWTFAARGGTHVLIQVGRFWVVFFVSLGLSELLLGLLYEGMGVGTLPAKLLTEGILVAFNFLALRHWTFR